MRHFQRWLVLILIGLLAQAAPLWAQEALPLTAGETVNGQLEGSSFAVYTFAIPAGEDAVVALNADHVVLPNYCVSIPGAAAECTSWGGGGDGAIAITFVIPARDIMQQVVLRLNRPITGAAQYTLSLYTLAAQTVTVGETFARQPATDAPFQLYALQADPAAPFSVTAVASDNDGFLWAAFEPYKLTPGFASESQLPIPIQVDQAATNASGGLDRLQLYYLGGDSFRVLVQAEAAYTLESTPVAITPLGAAQAMTVRLSYRQPLTVVRLASADAGAVVLNVEVTSGDGAFLWLYRQEQDYPDTRALGISVDGKTELPPAMTLDLPASAADQLVAVQIPFIHTRDAVVVSVEWEPQ